MIHSFTSKRSRELIFIILVCITSFFLRFYLIPEKLFFGPEQGRDFLVVKDIVINHNVTLIGSKTDIEGVFHGPIFYYLATIPFLLGKGDPVILSGFFIILNALSVIPIYLLGKKIANKRVAMFAAIIFTFSYTAIVYARWLSNPPLSIPVSALFFLTFYYYSKGKDWYLLLSAFLVGILVQIQFLNLIFFIGIFSVLLLLHYNRVRSTSLLIIISSAILLIFFSVGNFILFDIRHNYLIIHSLGSLVSGKAGFYISLSQILLSGLMNLSDFFTQTIFPILVDSRFKVGLTSGLIALFVFLPKNKNSIMNKAYLIVWLFIPMLILIVLRHEILFHFFIPLLVPMILLVSVLIDRLFTKHYILGLLVLGLILVSNMVIYMRNIQPNKNIFFQQNQLDLNIKDQKKVIDAIYKDANNQPFSFQSYTIPYWSQQAWEYLFWHYGEQRYGYAPVPEKAERLYVIIQDDPSSKQFQSDWLEHTVSKWGKEVSEFRYGILTVKRLKVENF